MIPEMFTRQQWLNELLRRFARRGHAPNLTLLQGAPAAEVELEPGEAALALVQAADGNEYALTDRRVVVRGETLIRYDSLVACHWVTDDPDPAVHVRLKADFFDRLILEDEDGRRVVLSQLGQAAFALERLFRFLVQDSQARRCT
jgi:hypothetical protein